MLEKQEESLQEVIQDVTLTAWSLLYGKSNPFDLDNRALLQEVREWAREFARQWENGEIREKDYMLAVKQFAVKKASDYHEPILKEYFARKGLYGDAVTLYRQCEYGSELAKKIRKRNWIVEGENIDLKEALGESTTMVIADNPVPRDFNIERAANIGGTIVLQGYYENSDEATVINLGETLWYPDMSDDILDAIAQATKNTTP